MSKNTERGIGQHVGPAADGRPDDTRPRLASETSIVGATPDKAERDGHVPKVEVAQITLLGVPAPELDREKVTTPGRDVHLPTEVRRVAGPRAVSGDAAASPESGSARKTPESARPRATAGSAPSVPVHTQDVMSSVNARLAEAGEGPRGDGPRRERPPQAGDRSMGRLDFGETTVMDAVPETGRGGPIALGIIISLVTAVAVVWTLRFGPHLRAFDAPVVERPASSGGAERGAERGPPAARELRRPAAQARTSLPADGEPSGPDRAAPPAAREWPAAAGTAAERDAPADDDTRPTREGAESAGRESRSANPAAAAGAGEEDGRRKNQRPRTPPAGERSGASVAGSKRAPSPPAFRGSTGPGLPAPSPPPLGAERAASPEPPRFEPPPLPSAPPPPPTRPAPTRDEKSNYDPDSPLPPAVGE